MVAPASTQRSTVKIWSTSGRPRWSISVVQGTTAREMDELVDLAVEGFELVRERLAERRRQERTPTVHAPSRQEGRA
jgi:hypothetical protein